MPSSDSFFQKYSLVLFFIYALSLFVFLWIFHFPTSSISDEFTYVLTAKSVAEEGYIDIWNGAEEFGNFSWEYVLPSTKPVGLRGVGYVIIGVAPLTYSIIAAPFYSLLGVEGIVLLSLSAYVLTLFVILFTIDFLFKDRRLSFLTVVVFSIFTFSASWAVSTIPHSLSTFLIFCSFSLVLFDYLGGGGGRRGLLLFSSGFFSSLAICLRLPNGMFTLILLGFVFYTMGLKRSSVFLFGCFWPAMALVLLNANTFGSPFVTGQGNLLLQVKRYGMPLLFLVVSVGLGSFFWKRKKFSLSRGSKIFLSVILVFVFVFFNSSVVLARILAFLFYMAEFQSLGGTQHIFAIYPVKALFQSSPFLIVGFIAPWIMKKRGVDANIILLFVLFGWTEVVSFGVAAAYGGEGSLHLRYFSESLPYLCALSMFVFLDVYSSVKRGRNFAFFLLFLFLASIILFYNITFPTGLGVDVFQYPLPLMYQTVYLVLISGLFIHVAAYFRGVFNLSFVPELFCVLVVCSFAYAFLINAADYVIDYNSESKTYAVSLGLLSIVEDDSAVFYYDLNNIHLLQLLKLEKKVRLLGVKNDGFNDFSELADFYTDRGNTVYVLVRSKYGRDLDPEWIDEVKMFQENNVNRTEIKYVNVQWPYRVD
ncbi:MAG: hypothetical protein ABH950_04955 [Candidatus Altiarchaeota archaeon]